MLNSERRKIEETIAWLSECRTWYPDSGIVAVIDVEIKRLEEILKQFTKDETS
jgi:hypothetical protein